MFFSKKNDKNHYYGAIENWEEQPETHLNIKLDISCFHGVAYDIDLILACRCVQASLMKYEKLFSIHVSQSAVRYVCSISLLLCHNQQLLKKLWLRHKYIGVFLVLTLTPQTRAQLCTSQNKVDFSMQYNAESKLAYLLCWPTNASSASNFKDLKIYPGGGFLLSWFFESCDWIFKRLLVWIWINSWLVSGAMTVLLSI